MDVILAAQQALKPIIDRGVPVQEGWYDQNQKRLHVSLWPLDESPLAASDDAEEIETAAIQITIFSTTEQEALREEIKQLMVSAGASYRGTDQQQTRIEAGIYIRPLRFEMYDERS